MMGTLYLQEGHQGERERERRMEGGGTTGSSFSEAHILATVGTRRYQSTRRKPWRAVVKGTMVGGAGDRKERL